MKPRDVANRSDTMQRGVAPCGAVLRDVRVPGRQNEPNASTRTIRPPTSDERERLNPNEPIEAGGGMPGSHGAKRT